MIVRSVCLNASSFEVGFWSVSAHSKAIDMGHDSSIAWLLPWLNGMLVTPTPEIFSSPLHVGRFMDRITCTVVLGF